MEMPVKVQPVNALQRIKDFLARRWPDVEFFPKIIQYSGGESLLLCWTDGPKEEDLKFCVELHKGAKLSSTGVIEPIETMLSLPGGGQRVIQAEFEFIMLRRYLTIPDDRKETSKLKII